MSNECKHCKGTGECKKAVIQGVFSFPKFFYCDLCGKGTTIYKESIIDDGILPTKPTCRACNGQGVVH